MNLHALTVPQDPEELKKNTLDVARLFVACGIDLMFLPFLYNHKYPRMRKLS